MYSNRTLKSDSMDTVYFDIEYRLQQQESFTFCPICIIGLITMSHIMCTQNTRYISNLVILNFCCWNKHVFHLICIGSA